MQRTSLLEQWADGALVRRSILGVRRPVARLLFIVGAGRSSGRHGLGEWELFHQYALLHQNSRVSAKLFAHALLWQESAHCQTVTGNMRRYRSWLEVRAQLPKITIDHDVPSVVS